MRDDPFETIRYINLTTFPGVDILSTCESSKPWHVYHERYAFCGCRISAAGLRYRGNEEHSNDGSSMLLEPGETHCNTTIRKRSELEVVFVPLQVLEGAARELGVSGPPHFEIESSRDPRLFKAVYVPSELVDSSENALAQQGAITIVGIPICNYKF